MENTKSTIQNKATENQHNFTGETATRNMPAVPVLQTKPNNTGLPDNLKSGVENLSGFSMDDVKVHYNSDKPSQLQALAYAQGTDIHVAPGQEKHLPHEAWHVVQQKQGRVQPTMQMKEGVVVNDDKGLENEADMMGGKAVQMISAFPIEKVQKPYLPHATRHVVQKNKKKGVTQKFIPRVKYYGEIPNYRQQDVEKTMRGFAPQAAVAINAFMLNPNRENDLCAGWAALHRREPSELVDIWEKVAESRKNQQALSDEDQQKAFCMYLRAQDHLGRENPGKGFLRPDNLALAEIGEVPSGDEVDKGKSKKESVKYGEVLKTAKQCRPKQSQKTKETSYFIEIYTEEHEAQVQLVGDKVVSICETEKAGILGAVDDAYAESILTSAFFSESDDRCRTITFECFTGNCK